jgi:hypothetical protein
MFGTDNLQGAVGGSVPDIRFGPNYLEAHLFLSSSDNEEQARASLSQDVLRRRTCRLG